MQNPNVLIFKDKETLSIAAAERFVSLAKEAVTGRGQFSVALSGGGTPQRLYELLAAPHRDQLPWAQMHFFWGDERCVPPDQEGSNYYQVEQTLFGSVPIPAGNVYRIRGELSPEKAAEDYAQQLRQFAASSGGFWPRFDLVLLGMGTDGHTASLFPGPIPDAGLTAPTLAVTANYGGRPAQRVTLTPPVFNAARRVFFLVTGKEKAATLDTVLNGPYDPQRLPAQRIRPVHGTVTWWVDVAGNW